MVDLAQLSDETGRGLLDDGQRVRLIDALPTVWRCGGAAGMPQDAWRRALGYTPAAWVDVHGDFRDVLEHDGKWYVPCLRSAGESQLRKSKAQKENADKRWEEERRRAAEMDAVALPWDSGGSADAMPNDASYSSSGSNGSIAPVAIAPYAHPVGPESTDGNGETEAPSPSSARPPSTRGKRLPKPYSEKFLLFWDAYACQRRTGKFAAWGQWDGLRCEPMSERVLESLAAFKRTPKWLDGFMPEPARWLKGRPWDDDALPTVPNGAVADAW